MSKKIILLPLSLFTGIGLLVWTTRFIGWQKITSAFLIFSGWQGIIILLLTILMVFSGVWKWKIILKSQGENIAHKSLIAPYLAGFAITYLFPILIFGGEIFRGYILKEKFSIPWAKAITSVILDRVLEITASLITIFAGLALFSLEIGLPPKNLGIILGGVLFFFSAAIGLFYFKGFRRESIIRLFAKIFNHKKFLNHQEPSAVEEEIFNFLKLKKKAFWQAIGISFLKVAAAWLRCWLLLLFLGKGIGAFLALPVLGFYYFSSIIPIPMTLGSHEMVQIFVFGALGLGSASVFPFTMTQRAAELILAFVGLAMFFKLGMGLLQAVLLRKLAG